MKRRSLDIHLDDGSLSGVELQLLQCPPQDIARSKNVYKAETRFLPREVQGKVTASPLAKIHQWLRIESEKDRKWIEPKDSILLTRKQRILQELHGGWRTGVALGALGAVIVLLINIILLIWIESDHHVSQAGTVTVFEGDCDKKTRISLWWHLAINVCSTFLLSASNNAMQCLTAPTRADIDKAHRKGRHLGVGIPSLKNLRVADSRRIALWCLLAVTSLPLHLFYNSVVSTTLQVNDYNAVLASKGFTSGSGWDQDIFDNDTLDDDMLSNLQRIAMQSNRTGLKPMDPTECALNYSSEFKPKWGSVVLTLDGAEASNRSVYYAYGYRADYDDSSTTICDTMNSLCTMSSVITNVTTGAPWNLAVEDLNRPRNDTADFYEYYGGSFHAVTGCYAQEVVQHCRVTFNVPLLVTVIICNSLKALVFIMILALPNFKPMITVGDAICSLLKDPDPETGDVGLGRSETKINGRQIPYATAPWKSHRCHWFCGASSRQWIVWTSVTLVITVPTLVLFLLYWESPFYDSTMGDSGASLKQLWSLGIGDVHTSTLVTVTSSAIGNALTANTPQLALSSIYVSYNLILTSMRMTAEYNEFASKRKPLRVSEPQGFQRPAYYLQLPYRYAVPLVIASGLLHWLVSQSFFPVNLNVFDVYGVEQQSRNVSACGWSPIAILFALILLGVMILTLFALGWRKYHTGMPVMRSNSLDISAACHMPITDPNAPLHPLAYGATSVQGWQKWHACFTDKEVVPLMRKHDGRFRLDVLRDDGDDQVGGFELPEELLGLRKDFPVHDPIKVI